MIALFLAGFEASKILFTQIKLNTRETIIYLGVAPDMIRRLGLITLEPAFSILRKLNLFELIFLQKNVEIKTKSTNMRLGDLFMCFKINRL